jgi:predicted Zn finger-like uncharacterized protein
MIFSCDCGAKLKIDDARIRDGGVNVRCPRCGSVQRVRRPEGTPAGQAMPWFAPESPGPAQPLVLIAHDSKVVADMIRTVLASDGMKTEYAPNGLDALKKATELRPHAMIVDVGLTGIYGFELCERLKGDPDTKNVKIILLSSVYDMTRYKRSPASLYGADDYIEKHHIPDKLAGKIRKLLSVEPEPAPEPASRGPISSRPPAPREFDVTQLSPREFFQGGPAGEAAAQSAGEEQDPEPVACPPAGDGRETAVEPAAVIPEAMRLDASIFQKDEYEMPCRDAGVDPEAIEKARRFARIIVSDIALYNQQAVVEGLRNGTFYELLKDDVREGRELYEKRVPPAIKAMKDYYQEAFDDFIASKKTSA